MKNCYAYIHIIIVMMLIGVVTTNTYALSDIELREDCCLVKKEAKKFYLVEGDSLHSLVRDDKNILNLIDDIDSLSYCEYWVRVETGEDDHPVLYDPIPFNKDDIISLLAGESVSKNIVCHHAKGALVRDYMVTCKTEFLRKENGKICVLNNTVVGTETKMDTAKMPILLFVAIIIGSITFMIFYPSRFFLLFNQDEKRDPIILDDDVNSGSSIGLKYGKLKVAVIAFPLLLF